MTFTTATWFLGMVAFLAAPARDVLPPSLDEPLQPLLPAQPRTEAQQDELTAAAHYAYARLLLLRGQRLEALRQLERAWRYDPHSVSLSEDIVPLAASLRRQDEAARYAVIAAEQESEDAQFVGQIAVLLVQQGDLPRAERLLSKAIKLLEGKPPTGQWVGLQVELGRVRFILEDPQGAGECFTVVRDAWDNPQAYGLDKNQLNKLIQSPELLHTLMGESFLAAGRYEAAADAYRRAWELSGDEARYAYWKARLAAAQKKWSSARSALDEYFAARSTVAGLEPYRLLEKVVEAESDSDDERTEPLLNRLGQLHEMDPDNQELAFFYASRLSNAGRLDEAEAILERLLAKDPSAGVLALLAKIYRQQRKVEPFIVLLGKAVSRGDDLQLLGPEKESLVGDAPLLDRLLELPAEAPDDSQPQRTSAEMKALALLAAEAKRYDVAYRWHEFLRDRLTADDHRWHRRFGLTLYIAGEADRAVKVFQEALGSDPSVEQAAEYHYFIAGAHQMAERTDEALAAARRAAALMPKDAGMQSRAAWILYRAGRLAEAKQAYEKVIDRFDAADVSPATRESLRDARLALSNICVELDDQAAAERWLEEVLDEFPEDPAALNDLGYLWADGNRHLNRALIMVQRAVEREPDNAAYRDSLGWAYYRLGRSDEALQQLRRAAETEPPDGVILDHLGDVQWSLGRREEAFQSWRRAVEQLKEQEMEDEAAKVEAKIAEKRSKAADSR